MPRFLSANAVLALTGLAITLPLSAQSLPIAPRLDESNFLNPPASVRPIYRWWLPLAAVDEAELRRELAQMRDAGAGGVEVAAMPLPGKTPTNPDLVREIGFGSRRWSSVLETIYRHAATQGLSVDLMVGPSWPTTVPSVSRIDHPAAQQKLVAGYEQISPGEQWSRAVPLPNGTTGADSHASRKLIAALAARCAGVDCSGKGGTRLLDPASVKDLTDRIEPDGRLRWRAPSGSNAWWIIALYQVPDGQRLEGLSDSSPNFVIDHLGLQGARAVTDFYDEVILTPNLRSLIGKAQSSLFEDSFEPSDGLKWTSTFLAEFKKRRGYSLVPYLPVLVNGGVGAQKGFFDIVGIGERVREDYRQTFSDLYADNHMKPYARWAHRVGMRTRLQVEGGPLEIADLAALPDIPEGENRNFLNNPELFKVIGTGAQLRPIETILSTECCPIEGGTWATTVGGPPFTIAQGTGAPFGRAGNDANLNWIYKAYAGGVNQLVWHGLPYLTTPPGSGTRARWPGNSFDGNTQFSEAFGPRMPQWDDYRAVNDHLARLQLVMRQGRPRYDLAIFWHDFGVNGIAPKVTAFTGYPGLSKLSASTSPLASGGFTYQYVSPSYLDEKTARDVRRGIWMPERMGFKAILLNDQAVMPLASLKHVRNLAMRGIPLIVIGRAPERVPGLRDARAADAALARIVKDLKALATRPGSLVRFVCDETEARVALTSMGIAPAAASAQNAGANDILTVRRQDREQNYYLLLNQGTRTVTTTLDLARKGTPAKLESWSGKIKPVSLFETTTKSVRIPITLASNDVALISLIPDPATEGQPIHATVTNGGTVHWEASGLTLRADHEGEFETHLSDGSTIRMHAEGIMPPQPLLRWSLVVESWGADDTRLPGLEHTLRSTLPAISVTATGNQSLPAWPELGLADKAGIGFYKTEFDLPQTWSPSDGAWLELGRVIDTFRVSVNGTPLSPLNQQDTSRVDVGRYLRPGSNSIEVRVATPLRNAVEAYTKEGARRLNQVGLLGPVILHPYRDYPLHGAATRRPVPR